MTRNRQLEELLLKMNKNQIDELTTHYENGVVAQMVEDQVIPEEPSNPPDDEDAFSSISW